MSKFFATDYSKIDHFKRCGYDYTKVSSDDKWMVWKMTSDGQSYGFELWKRKNVKNPDGSIVWAAPSDEDFGIYGWYIFYRDDEVCWKRISELKEQSEKREKEYSFLHQ